uniref:Uncharacterized protein n=1 Tax=Lepeophtheirus salmonis TaxID=72036 RepID=A0A0K2U3L4_LEPSM
MICAPTLRSKLWGGISTAAGSETRLVNIQFAWGTLFYLWTCRTSGQQGLILEPLH